MTASLKSPTPRHLRLPRRRRGILPRLGNFLIGDLYHALRGTGAIPARLIRRAVANGLGKEEFELAVRQAQTRENLGKILLSVSQDRLNKALYWNELGLKPRARDNFLDSAIWAMYAETCLGEQFDRTLFQQYVNSYAMAAPNFVCPAQPVQIPFSSGSLAGYLRLPQEAPGEDNLPWPCVILFNCLHSPKEELHFTENAFLAAGMATLSFDYPGFNESGGRGVSAFDVQELGNSIHLFLSACTEINPARLAMHGLSFGGRLALFLAWKFADRFKAVASLSAPFDPLADLDLLVCSLKREFFVSGAAAKATIFDLSRQTPIKGHLADIQAPVLVAGGGKDLIALPEETRLIYEQCENTGKKLILCPAAGHVCYEMMPSLRHEIAQWVFQRL